LGAEEARKKLEALIVDGKRRGFAVDGERGQIVLYPYPMEEGMDLNINDEQDQQDEHEQDDPDDEQDDTDNEHFSDHISEQIDAAQNCVDDDQEEEDSPEEPMINPVHTCCNENKMKQTTNKQIKKINKSLMNVPILLSF